MLRRCATFLLFGLAPLVTACPAPAPASGPVAATASTAAPAWAQEMLSSLNASRSVAGRAPLALCGTLTVAAQRHSLDQAAHNSMTHVGSDGSRLDGRAGSAGYLGWNALAENVAYGQRSVGDVMNAWMNSAGHRANILNGALTHVGFGQATSSQGAAYWTQDFGSGGSC